MLIIVVHNVRSAHNVGSILRSADGLGIERVYLTGYTPYPPSPGDQRLPYLAQKAGRQIHKTALGAEATVRWQHEPDVIKAIDKLRAAGYRIAALEQTSKSLNLAGFKPPGKLALVVGSEVGGLDKMVLELCDSYLQIPMSGQKESFNVAVAAAIALYHLKNLT
ncbi:MAG TPA: TrmH family RNA methyltransferase [Candidatus Saccharimonadales bacterium]|nr:TrmH family RNA methyltransferase [Candidatus Saccharimonadales bacterium]